MNTKILSISALLIGLTVISAFFWGGRSSKDSSISHTEVTATTSRNASTAHWASSAMTVNELMSEANLVVRVRVSEVPVTRIVQVEAPMLDEVGNAVDSAVIKVLFSDTVFEVLETYMGKPSLKITVAQDGGFDQTVSNGVEETADDPLYNVGEEYILFLVDISGDPIHAPDRELYRVINPFGRYRIDGESVFSYGQFAGQYAGMDTFSVIKNISELKTQIGQAISFMPTPAP